MHSERALLKNRLPIYDRGKIIPMSLTQSRLKELLFYDPMVGIFIHVKGRGGVTVGTRAGMIHKSDQYRYTRVDGSRYSEHRLAWLYISGDWPLEIDHINGNRQDNRFENLRNVLPGINQQNRHRKQKNNKTGFLGVCRWYERYVAQITINGAPTHIGVFDTPEEAHAAYLEKKRTVHPGCTI